MHLLSTIHGQSQTKEPSARERFAQLTMKGALVMFPLPIGYNLSESVLVRVNISQGDLEISLRVTLRDIQVSAGPFLPVVAQLLASRYHRVFRETYICSRGTFQSFYIATNQILNAQSFVVYLRSDKTR